MNPRCHCLHIRQPQNTEACLEGQCVNSQPNAAVMYEVSIHRKTLSISLPRAAQILHIPLGPYGRSAWLGIVNPLGHCWISAFPCHLCFCPCLPAGADFLGLVQSDAGSALWPRCHTATLTVWDGWERKRKMYKVTSSGKKEAVKVGLEGPNSYAFIHKIFLSPHQCKRMSQNP